jgi:hypothetical protein
MKMAKPASRTPMQATKPAPMAKVATPKSSVIARVAGSSRSSGFM